MKRSISALTLAAAGAAGAAPAFAADLKVTYDVPRIPVAEYHAPYVVVWIENTATGEAAGTLSLRFRPNHEKWLKDMRQWWRKAGRAQGADLAGVTGPTRAPGVQDMTFSGAKSPLKELKPGQYSLVVEAAREGGGHESVRVPFTWGRAGRPATAKGAAELGVVTVAVK
ncbi:DUF2271 domain-containing protein [Phenylobacterium immobile]|uniref:DUF2271 domain-containing protein n=1 Tax=Phenylobacterium immobile TaxID=21 RepID=UPI000A8AC285|nr:DUF2271 domain-containing protein [Phenylobacterium immobile]